MLLIVYSINTLAFAGAGRWLLCVGCDAVGLTLIQTDSRWLGNHDSCCETINSAEGNQQPDRLVADESGSACDCVRIPIQNHDLTVVPSSPGGAAPAFELLGGMAMEDLLLDLPTGSVTARGPPDVGWLPARLTLLGQLTSLMI